MAPKKTKKIDLNSFMGDNAGGSWADDLDALPTAPAAVVAGTAGSGAGGVGGPRESGFRERMGSSRPELPFPTRPPYTASVNNLSYEITEHDIRQLFEFLKIKAIRIVMSEGRPKGNAFVEFETPEDLREALKRSGSDVIGRTAYVHIAAPESRADSESTWVRRGPLGPPEDGGRGGRSRGFGGAGSHASSGSWDRQGPLPPLENDRRRGGPASRADSGSWERQGPLPPRNVSNSSSRADNRSWERQGPLPPVENKNRSGNNGPSRDRDFSNLRRDRDVSSFNNNSNNSNSNNRRSSGNSSATAQKEEELAKRRGTALSSNQA